MNCNVIKDLLPSYIDGICSEDTAKIVEDHIQHCKKCEMCLNRMQQQTAYVQQMPKEVEKAITPFKKINKKRRIQVITAIVMTFIISIIGAFVIQDVGVVNQIFFPMVTAIVVVEDDSDEWQSISFDDKSYLIYDSVFWKKSIVNHANSESDILLRVKDVNGNVVFDEIQVKSGTSVELEGLKKKEKYFFEVKATQGRYFINAV